MVVAALAASVVVLAVLLVFVVAFMYYLRHREGKLQTRLTELLQSQAEAKQKAERARKAKVAADAKAASSPRPSKNGSDDVENGEGTTPQMRWLETAVARSESDDAALRDVD